MMHLKHSIHVAGLNLYRKLQNSIKNVLHQKVVISEKRKLTVPAMLPVYCCYFRHCYLGVYMCYVVLESNMTRVIDSNLEFHFTHVTLPLPTLKSRISFKSEQVFHRQEKICRNYHTNDRTHQQNISICSVNITLF